LSYLNPFPFISFPPVGSDFSIILNYRDSHKENHDSSPALFPHLLLFTAVPFTEHDAHKMGRLPILAPAALGFSVIFAHKKRLAEYYP